MNRSYFYITRSRSTGASIQTCNAEFMGLSDEDGPYVTMCCSHENLVHHSTLTDARKNASHPEVWCEGCRLVAARKGS